MGRSSPDGNGNLDAGASAPSVATTFSVARVDESADHGLPNYAGGITAWGNNRFSSQSGALLHPKCAPMLDLIRSSVALRTARLFAA
jgi:hypothetical protein